MSYRTALLIVAVTHLVGAVGLRSPLADWMVLLTPVHLLLTFALLFWFSDRSEQLKASLLAIFGLGLGIEILGVNTGFPLVPTSTSKDWGRKSWKPPGSLG